MTEKWKELASLESLMFRQIEIAGIRKELLEEKQRNDARIERILRENDMDFHSARMDENFHVVAQIKEDRKKVFEKERMADDLGISPASTQQKDVLINLTEQQKLTLDRFKKYFSWEPSSKLSVTKKKIKKPKKQKKAM